MGHPVRRLSLIGLEGGEDDDGDEDAHEERAFVCDGVYDRVFIELCAGGEEPELRDPEEENGQQKPEAAGVVVEVCVQIGDVEHEDDG